MEDSATLELFAKGLTKGIFQFEQPGAISLLKRVKPTRFGDIVATTSLNRPGASDYSENFVQRKQGKEAVVLLIHQLLPFLNRPTGLCFIKNRSCRLLKCMLDLHLGKLTCSVEPCLRKNAQEMQAMEADFLIGAEKNGHEKSKPKIFFAMMAKFAGYGFNRSHAYAYSALAFQMAFLKLIIQMYF